jgi:hypothetical protein
MLWIDGASIGSGITSTLPNSGKDLWIGQRTDGYAVNGDIAALMLVGSDLALSDREKIEGHLAWKYGLTANLPANHTYKNSPPTTSGTPTPPDSDDRWVLVAEKGADSTVPGPQGPPGASNDTTYSFPENPPANVSTGQALTVGVVFSTSANGHLTQIIYYKTSGETATSRQVGVWKADGTLLYSQTATDTGFGWNTVTLSTPVSIGSGNTYYAGYEVAHEGGYGQSGGGAAYPVTIGPLTATNGCYVYAPFSFPSSTYSAWYAVNLTFATPGIEGPPGPPGADSTVPGPTGPPGPSAVSADSGNVARLGSDSLIFVPPPLNYSTTETWTGLLWLDGRKIYQKTVDLGLLVTANVAHDVVNLKQLIRLWGGGMSPDGLTFLPLPYDDPANWVHFYVTTANIVMNSPTFTTWTGQLTLQYTCTDR